MKQSWRMPPAPSFLFPLQTPCGAFAISMFITVFRRQQKNLRDITRFFRLSVWLRLNARLFWQIVSHNLRRVLFLHIAKNNKHNALLPILLLLPHLIYGRSSDCLASWFYFISFHFVFCLLFIDSFCWCTGNVMRAHCLQTVFACIFLQTFVCVQRECVCEFQVLMHY